MVGRKGSCSDGSGSAAEKVQKKAVQWAALMVGRMVSWLAG
jgi:hypothetical protein